jgi:hypothetical protein
MTGVGTRAHLLRSGSEVRTGGLSGALALSFRIYCFLVLVWCRELLWIHVCQAQPPQVDFGGIKISVESRVPVGSGSVAIRFGGEKFITTQDQEGRSVALRLVRKPQLCEESEDLLPSIVSAAVTAQDSQILTEIIEQALSTARTNTLNSATLWGKIVETPLGQRLVKEAVSSGASQYSEGICLASLALSRQGASVPLSEQVSSKCLASAIDDMVGASASNTHGSLSDKRVQNAMGAFARADVKALDNARLLARSLRQIQEAKTVESYLAGRSELSRGFSERGAPKDIAAALSSLDNAFLERSISGREFSQALKLVPYLAFDRRTQRTHEVILEALRAVNVDDAATLRQKDVIEVLLQFAERDTEIADALGRHLSIEITKVAQREDAQAAIDLLHQIRRGAEPMSRRLEPSVFTAIASLLGRGEFDGATRLQREWGGRLPLSLMIRWWFINARVVTWGVLFGGVALCALLLSRRRSLSGQVSEGRPDTFHIRWPAGYEEAMRKVGLMPGISLIEIKQAYRLAIKRQHPDLNPDASAEQQAQFRELVADFERVIQLHQHIR